MPVLPWSKKSAEIKLSTYIDGELEELEATALDEHLVFDTSFKEKREAYTKASELANAAMAPPQIPDSTEFADCLIEVIGGPAPREQPLPAPSRKKLSPALLASIGIALTAGLTFAGLRRRGII